MLKRAEACFTCLEISNVILTLLIQSTVLGPVMLTHLMVLKKYTYLLSSTISGNLVDNIRRAIINNVNRETHLTNSAIDLLYQSCMDTEIV